MSPVRVVAVDDEKPARDRVRRLLERDTRLEVASCCAGGAEAVRTIRDAARAGAPVQLLLLDVQMPEMDGFGVLAALLAQQEAAMPAVVFASAHDEYALRAFDAHAVDYLLKPFSDERFEAAIDRALRHLRAGDAEALLAQMQALLGNVTAGARRGPEAPAGGTIAPLDRIVLKGTDRVRLLPVQQITWIEAAGMYVKLHMRDGGVHLHRSLLGDLDAALDPRRFVRVHRSAIVNVDVIEELRQDAHGDYTVTLKDRTEVRLGRSYRARLQDRLGQDL
jgi:two-component system LytT family response regulator